MCQQILSTVDANVIVVDWKKGANIHTGYYYATVNTEVVGTILALLVRSLERHQGADKSHFHIIGHSLGAHVAGFSGSAYKKTRYQRITGLDPAGLFFRKKGRDARLDETDAHFVDVIHTDGGITGFGYLNAMGHVDFYPNGGQSQPGCYLTCSHSRAYEYFTESILSNEAFRAWECETLDQCTSLEGLNTTQPPDNRMGFYVHNPKENKMYYLRTNREAPFNIPPEP
ncbi:inactive pancreatic lipase-related protein 1-like [Saccostrea cucullata]|uniref:inactive pancreatic lipase-related protein 1-like n=1 Tax=Saccostrea cuccullata TaxID=36930 RepID=UPI002ED08A6B